MLDRFLNTDGYPDFFGVYEDTLRDTHEQYVYSGTFFLDERYLDIINRELNVFPTIINELVEGAAIIREDSEAAEYALFVSKAMENRGRFAEYLPCFTFPDEYPFLPLLCFVPFFRSISGTLEKRGVPDDVISATLRQFEDCTYIYKLRFDRLGLNKRYFDWLQLYVDCRILNISRLRFELMESEDPVFLLENRRTGERIAVMGKCTMNSSGLYAGTPPVFDNDSTFPTDFVETDEFYIANPVSASGRCGKKAVRFAKNEYRILFRPGDCCLSVHIPDKGELTEAACTESYRRAVEVFDRCFHEYEIKCFRCHSWMMAPELSDLIRRDSKIVAFNRPYIKYPVETEGKDVLNFVFLLKFRTYEDLLENTSLQRALKRLYLSGQYLYEYGGLFPVSDVAAGKEEKEALS